MPLYKKHNLVMQSFFSCCDLTISFLLLCWGMDVCEALVKLFEYFGFIDSLKT